MILRHSIRLWAGAAVLALVAVPALSRAADLPVAIVADFANTSRDRHTIFAEAATDAIAAELNKRKVYEVVTRGEVQRAAARLSLQTPLSDDDLSALAKELGATLIVTGEVRDVDIRSRGGQREVALGLIVRVRDIVLGEMVNGAAERAVVTVPAGSGKTDAEVAVDAADLAANRAVSRIEDYHPITGTIMNTSGIAPMMFNRGLRDGIKPRQEFIVYRGNRRVGRVRAATISDAYTELTVLENEGIQPQDLAQSLFPEPRFRK